MNATCPVCHRPSADTLGAYVGTVRFCGPGHVALWFRHPSHDRRTHRRPVPVDRRGVAS